MSERNEDEKLQFMNRMLETYKQVHNSKYWSEVTSVLSGNSINRVLDIGCGPGLLLRDAITKFDAKEVIGIDLSDIMLNKAKELLSLHENTTNIILTQQHMQEKVDLPPEIDAIFSSRVMRSFENILHILQSIYQNLSENGYFILLDWDKRDISEYSAYFETIEYFKDISLEEKIRLHRNFSRYGMNDWKYLLESTGFTIVHSFQLNPVLIVVIGQKL